MRTRAAALLPAALLLTSPVLADDLEPGLAGDLTLDLVLSDLNVPTGGAFLPDGRLLITEQFSGRVQLWDGTNAPRTIGQFNVQTGNERGLLGIAVDPEFETSRRIYVYLSTGGAQAAGYVTMDAATDELDVAGLTLLIEGMASSRNHNGGAIAFGPDGHLYLGVGDTGCNCGCAPGTNRNNFFPACLNSLHGKVLRIDRDGNIPETNPLVNVSDVPACTAGGSCNAANDVPSGSTAPRTELYNWGFRNPFRFAFDEQTGHLWIGDVGERTWEEITVSTGPGQNHGWPFREGADGQPVSVCSDTTPVGGDCRDPALAYRRTERPQTNAASVTGGVFSNHCSWPESLRGLYWFGDFAKSRVWSVTPNEARDGVTGDRTVVVTGAQGPVQFMASPNGGIYYLNVNTGTLWRVGPANPEPCEGMDAGVAPDSGAQTPDSGSTAPDAGEPAPDAGTPPEDAGSVEPTPDAGSAAPDAGDPGDEDGDDGCRCVRPDDAGTTVWGWAIVGSLTLLGGARRRRRAGR